MNMLFKTMVTGCLGLVLLGCEMAQADQVVPATEPDALTQTVESEDRADSVTDLLGRIEAQTSQVKTLHARLRYTTIQGLLGDEQVRFGELWYAAPDAFAEEAEVPAFERLAVHIQREKRDEPVVPANQWLVFDGRFFLERDEADRRAVRRELLPADEPQAAALPLPIRLDREETQMRFDVIQRDDDARPEDAPAGITLDFTPKPGFEAEPMVITFDADSLLPLEVRFGELDGDLTIFRLIDLEANSEKVDRDLFDTRLPEAPGWDNQFVPFGE
ncbi:MAG: outer membrane lipoprotein carrier protein LolA [Planctomycetota bacterium]